MDTTDDLSEIFDIVDREDKVIGRATRREVHGNKNLLHRSVGVAVINSNNKIFLQRRSITKDTDSLKWTISCSGHVAAGDTYEDTARRELSEELGIADRVLLNYLCKYIYESNTETEMVCLYKIIYNGSITVHTEEILEGKFFTRKEIIRASSSGEISLNDFGKIALQKIGWL